MTPREIAAALDADPIAGLTHGLGSGPEATPPEDGEDPYLCLCAARAEVCLYVNADDFGEVIANCPPAVKAVRGHNDQKIFDPIAVQWTRGAHQAVSVRILAQYLGARPAGTVGARGELAFCRERARGALKRLLARARSLRQPNQPKHANPAEEDFAGIASRERGWSSFGNAGDGGGANPNSLAAVFDNPMVMNPMAHKAKAGSPAAPAQQDRSL